MPLAFCKRDLVPPLRLILMIVLYYFVVHYIVQFLIIVTCLALTSPIGGGRSVGIVRSRTKATEFVCLFVCLLYCIYSFSDICIQPDDGQVK